MKPGFQEWLECIACHARYDVLEIRYRCNCGDLLSVQRTPGWAEQLSPSLFDSRRTSRNELDQSGVWRFREGVLQTEPQHVVTHPEGSTRLYQRPALSTWADVPALHFKHEGENPTGSFKDRGMTVAATQARRVGARAVACASTGNTSASLAAYAAQAGMKALVFVPAGKISSGKMAQTLGYGAFCLQVRGDFDAAMALVQEVCQKLNVYLLNSINPFRVEGQKTIVWEMLQDLAWDAPDWIALPAGNLGNTSAFGKALLEAHQGGWIKKLPRLLAVQATGANPFFLSYQDGFRSTHRVTPETVASAIRIGNPVSHAKAVEAIQKTGGSVTQVSDEELMLAKREIDRAGIGCEPASACSLAGVRKLRQQGVIERDARVVCVLTGNMLKDPDATVSAAQMGTSVTAPEVEPRLSDVENVLARTLGL
ncbi:MAG: threonine synthase [Myxococcota bacterium]